MYNVENIKKSAIYELLAKLSDKTPNWVKRYFNRNNMDVFNIDDVIKYIKDKRWTNCYYDRKNMKFYEILWKKEPFKRLKEREVNNIELQKSFALWLVEFDSVYSI